MVANKIDGATNFFTQWWKPLLEQLWLWEAGNHVVVSGGGMTSRFVVQVSSCVFSQHIKKNTD